jgi:periplasmic divalent cation tolerance protein
MSDFVEIHWTAGSIEEARKISRYLVQEHFVACANIIPWVESIFMWNNKLETQQESKVVLKTQRKKFEEVKKAILENCSYEVPEITMFSIENANIEYLNWMKESTQDFLKPTQTT